MFEIHHDYRKPDKWLEKNVLKIWQKNSSQAFYDGFALPFKSKINLSQMRNL